MWNPVEGRVSVCYKLTELVKQQILKQKLKNNFVI